MNGGKRRSGLRAAALVAAALLLGGVAAATTFRIEEVKCPACAASFRAEVVNSTNTFGGVDADGCEQANGLTPFPYLVRACPKCLCARIPLDWEKAPKGAAAKAFLEKAAKEPRFAPDGKSGAVPLAVRFELAAELLEAEGRPHAGVWLHAAWTLRGEVREARIHAEEDLDPSLPEGWGKAMDEAWRIERTFDPGLPGRRTSTGREIHAAREALRAAEAAGPASLDALLNRLHVAVVLRVHGEISPAAAILEELARSGGGAAAPEGEKAARAWVAAEAARLLPGIAREREYLGRARDTLLAAKKLSPWAEWTLSECYRRLGDDANAAKRVGGVFAKGALPEHILVLLRDAADYAGAGTPAWKAAVEKGWTERLDFLVSRLGDLEQGDEAVVTLGRLAEPSVIPALVRALGGEETAANAAGVLAGYEEPGDEALRALEALAGNADGDAVVRWRAVDALADYGHPRHAPLLRKAAADASGPLLESAVRGLGLSGEASDAALLLKAAEEEPDAALRALGLLAGREFPDLAEAKVWWAKRGDLAPEARLAEVLRAADPKLSDADGPARRAALVELLLNTSMGVRWNAFRALRAETGRGPGRREVLYEGRMDTSVAPDAPLDLERALGDGVIVSHIGIPSIDYEGMGIDVKPLRDKNGRGIWRRAQIRWRHLLGIR